MISSAMPSDYFRLLKPRVMVLVIFTAIVGLLMAPGEINWFIGSVAILCISIGAGASGSLNMWYDADIDAIMGRTAKRPVPSGKIEGSQALSFGLILSFFSVMVMGLVVNWFSALFLAFTIFFYAVIYTMWLKRSTPQNIVIGGAAGAFPPMIGWAAVTGSVSFESAVLFAIIFLWTPPHFWALALFRLQDYEHAQMPMMPNVYGEKRTRFEIVIYSILLGGVSILPTVMGFASIAYGIVAAGLGARFAWLGFQVWKNGTKEDGYSHEKKLFKYSIIYLFAIFGALGIDALAKTVMVYYG
ncbi:MAG: heme o synthase [Nitratireductor sp.]